MTTIYADSTWALPSSGVSDMQCFYNCKKLVGGNGTAWSSSNTGYTYMRIDRAGQAGYLTAACENIGPRSSISEGRAHFLMQEF